LSNFLYLGDISNGKNLTQIENLKIENILNLSSEIVEYPKKIHSLHLKTDVSIPLEECVEYIQESKGRVLVFCDDGVSKGATVVTAYLMQDLKKKGSTFNPIVCVTSVERCRPMVKVEKKHFGQLMAFEKELSNGEEKKLVEDNIEVISID
jgi:protein-tyrosine phosphatase